ncbi:MAG TPA: hypothetical protein VH374_26340 [Polyangia bacterium]|jgi:hypothetical protein|nr:hypothetical protein [Polyangia bacterium]
MTALHHWLQLIGDVLFIVGVITLYRIARRALRDLTRPRSPRDGGIPRNMIPPRSHLVVKHFRIQPGVFWRIDRTPFAAVRDKFEPAALVQKWISWQWTACAFTHGVTVMWWTEREASQ